MEHLTGTRIRREATPATVNLRRCKLVIIKAGDFRPKEAAPPVAFHSRL